jgi:hypothetical protein
VPDGQELFLFRGGPFYVVQRAAGFIGPRGEMLTGARRSSSSPPGFRSSCWRRSRASRSAPLAASLRILGGSLVRRFDERWLDASPEQAADLLEHPDPSALADYSTVYGAVKGMRVVPFGRPALVAVAVVAALP